MMPVLLFLMGAVCALLLLVALIAAYFLRPVVRFRALLRVADSLREKGDLPGAIKLAEHLLNAPPHVQKKAGPILRYTLAFWYLEAGRANEAEEACRRVLQAPLPPAWEAKVRRRLAQSLENQDRETEARNEEIRADNLLQTDAPESAPMVLLVQAERLADESRFAEAAQKYEAALADAEKPGGDVPLRCKAMVQAALAHYQCGHYRETVRWSETALHSGADGMVRLLAHRAAGIGSTGLGEWEMARTHKQAALSISRDMANPEQIARSLVGLAGLEQQIGHITQAMQLLEEASQAGGASVKFDVCVGQAECLQTWGRFDEAEDALKRAEAAPIGTLKKTRDRQKRLLLLGLARLEADRERPEHGLPPCEAALAAFENDAKLVLWCRAEHLALRSMLVDTDNAGNDAGVQTLARDETALLAEAEARDGDRNSRMVVYAAVARSRFYRRAFDESLAMWKRYLDEVPAPVSVPKALFFRGKCWEGKNEPEFARSLFRDAIQTGLDVRYTRLAQKHLDAPNTPPQNGGNA